VFAGIQVSTGFAALWSQAMGLLGHPWVITCDLTDLLALPMLWVSWRALTPAMDGERPALVGVQRSAVAAASVFGLWATVATSDDSYSEDCCWDGTGTGGWGETEGDPEWEDVRGQVYVHNPNDFAISINVRVLDSGMDIDCAAIATDPGRLLPDEAFEAVERWELPPGTNVAVDMYGSNPGCLAAKVTGEGIPDQILFSTTWSARTTFVGSHASLDELGPRGAALLFGSEGGGAEWVGGDGWRFSPSDEAPTLPEDCQPSPAERNLDWSKLPVQMTAEIVAVTPGLDGCFDIDLQPWAADVAGQPFTWYLCAPAAAVRFEAGEYWSFESAGDHHFVTARLAEADTQEVLVDEQNRPLRTLHFERNLSTASFMPPGVQASPSPIQPSCPWAVSSSCAPVTRPLALTIGNGAVEVVPGEVAVHVDAAGVRHELSLGRARAVGLAQFECDADLPHDIDFALVSEPEL
jgi:hypothetical protein